MVWVGGVGDPGAVVDAGVGVRAGVGRRSMNGWSGWRGGDTALLSAVVWCLAADLPGVLAPCPAAAAARAGGGGVARLEGIPLIYATAAQPQLHLRLQVQTHTPSLTTLRFPPFLPPPLPLHRGVCECECVCECVCV